MIKDILNTLAQGKRLSREETRNTFNTIMQGEATPAQIGAVLMAMRVQGETTEQLAGAVEAMRANMLRVNAPDGAMDTCGTGGDAKGSHNISTAAAFVVAGAGVTVAKHGNRALSSKSGSADVLTALGVNLDAPVEVVERAIAEVGIGFMMAPRHHSAMRHVAAPRQELGTRTIFNLLGPMSNPAGVRHQMVGVFAKEWLEPMAQALGTLGAERAWVVAGSDGMDEITLTGSTDVAEWHDGQVRSFTLNPEEFGLQLCVEADLKGGDAAFNAEAIRALFGGDKGALRDIVCLNAAACLVVAGRAADIANGLTMAAHAIDSGAALTALDGLVSMTRGDNA